ncbi:TPA: hypothetical protein ACSPZU_003779 [Aeromonas veronii]
MKKNIIMTSAFLASVFSLGNCNMAQAYEKITFMGGISAPGCNNYIQKNNIVFECHRLPALKLNLSENKEQEIKNKQINKVKLGWINSQKLIVNIYYL